jgi:hypothetical protein
MLTPLNQFFCDTCGEIINSPEQGWIEWISKYDENTQTFKTHSFRIVHNYVNSPNADRSNSGCYQHTGATGRHDSHLHSFLNEDYKMAKILKFLDIGSIHDPDYKGTSITDLREYVEIVRRLTIPHYEEARKYWAEALEDGFFQDANEISVYGINNLKQLISIYGDK